MVKNTTTFGESTSVSIGLVVLLLSLCAWVTTIKANTDQNSDDIKRLETIQQDFNMAFKQIDERLSRIEGKLNVGN